LENEQVEFTLAISDFPTGENYSIQLETDLVKVDGSAIYDFMDLAETYYNVDVYKKNIEFSPLNSNEINILIRGKTPQIGIENSLDEIKIVKFNSGPYKYYEVRILDPYNNVIYKEMNNFKLENTDQEEFNDKLDRITISELNELKKFTGKLFEKGLVDEANVLVNLLSKLSLNEPDNDECLNISYITVIIVIITILLCGMIGFVIGKRSVYHELSQKK